MSKWKTMFYFHQPQVWYPLAYHSELELSIQHFQKASSSACIKARSYCHHADDLLQMQWKDQACSKNSRCWSLWYMRSLAMSWLRLREWRRDPRDRGDWGDVWITAEERAGILIRVGSLHWKRWQRLRQASQVLGGHGSVRYFLSRQLSAQMSGRSFILVRLYGSKVNRSTGVQIVAHAYKKDFPWHLLNRAFLVLMQGANDSAR